MRTIPVESDRASCAAHLLPLQLQLTTGRNAAGVSKITTIPVTIQAVASKFASANLASAAKGVAYTLLFLLYLLTVMNSQLVMSSVAEEKTSRIAELLDRLGESERAARGQSARIRDAGISAARGMDRGPRSSSAADRARRKDKARAAIS